MGRWGGRDSPYSKDGGPGSGPQKGKSASQQPWNRAGKPLNKQEKASENQAFARIQALNEKTGGYKPWTPGKKKGV